MYEKYFEIKSKISNHTFEGKIDINTVDDDEPDLVWYDKQGFEVNTIYNIYDVDSVELSTIISIINEDDLLLRRIYEMDGGETADCGDYTLTIL